MHTPNFYQASTRGRITVPGTCVIGLQWGDEAKGKLVDLLTPNFDIVCRYQGGSNAGHTVVTGDKVYKLHLGKIVFCF